MSSALFAFFDWSRYGPNFDNSQTMLVISEPFVNTLSYVWHICNFDFIFWLIYVCDQIRRSLVVLNMFFYIDYYTDNPVLVSSDGTGDIFHVQSKSNCCSSSFVQLYKRYHLLSASNWCQNTCKFIQQSKGIYRIKLFSQGKYLIIGPFWHDTLDISSSLPMLAILV